MTVLETMIEPLLEARASVAQQSGRFLGETERLVLWLAVGQPDSAEDRRQLSLTMTEAYDSILKLERLMVGLADGVRAAQAAGNITAQPALPESRLAQRVLS